MSIEKVITIKIILLSKYCRHALNIKTSLKHLDNSTKIEIFKILFLLTKFLSCY